MKSKFSVRNGRISVADIYFKQRNTFNSSKLFLYFDLVLTFRLHLLVWQILFLDAKDSFACWLLLWDTTMHKFQLPVLTKGFVSRNRQLVQLMLRVGDPGAAVLATCRCHFATSTRFDSSTSTHQIRFINLACMWSETSSVRLRQNRCRVFSKFVQVLFCPSFFSFVVAFLSRTMLLLDYVRIWPLPHFQK